MKKIVNKISGDCKVVGVMSSEQDFVENGSYHFSFITFLLESTGHVELRRTLPCQEYFYPGTPCWECCY